MRAIEVILNLALSYTAANVPTLREYFSKSPNIHDRLKVCYERALQNWSVSEERKKQAINEMERHLQELISWVNLDDNGRHPKTIELLRLWGQEICNDEKCIPFILNLRTTQTLKIAKHLQQRFDEQDGVLRQIVGQTQKGITPCERYWEQWSRGEDLSLNYDIVLAGRDEAQQSVRTVCKNPQVIYIQAVSQQEAIAFSVAAVLNSKDQSYLRTIVVTDKDSYNTIANTASSLIIITTCTENICYALDRGHSVICCLSPAYATKSPKTIQLPTLERDGFISSLERSGIDRTQASKFAQESARDISVLRRILGFDIAAPHWLTKENIQLIIPALLLGQWEHNNEYDRSMVELITADSYERYLTRITSLRSVEDSPLLCIGSIWRVKSPYDLMKQLYDQISDIHLSRFREVIQWLSDDDDLNAIDKMNANGFAIWEHRQIFSASIKEGVYQSLALYNILSDKLGESNDFVENIVRNLFKNFNLERYLSNKNYLGWFAEAAPQVILEFVQNDMLAGAPFLSQIMQIKNKNHRDVFSDEIYYTELLFCLEKLAWDPDYLAPVTDILLHLCSYPNDSNYVNRPSNTLYNIYRFILPQTYTEFNKRSEILNAFSKNYPDQVCELCYELLNRLPQSSTLSPTSHFRWRLFDRISTSEYFSPIAAEHVIRIAELMLSLMEYNEDTVCKVIRLSYNKKLSVIRERLLDFVNSEKETLRENLSVVDVIHENIIRHERVASTSWALSSEELAPYKNLLTYFEPKDSIKRHRHLFSYRLFFEKGTDEEQKGKTSELQVEALSMIIGEYGLDGIWALAKECRKPEGIAIALAKMYGRFYCKIVYESYIHGKIEENFICKYFSAIFRLIGIAEYTSIIDTMLEIDRDCIAPILYAPGFNKELIKRLSTLSSNIQDEYWQKVSIWGINQIDLRSVIKPMRRARSYKLLLEILALHDKDNLISDEDKIEILDEIFQLDPQILDREISSVVEILKGINLPENKAYRDTLLMLEFFLYEELCLHMAEEDIHFLQQINKYPEIMLGIIQMYYLPDENLMHERDSLSDETKDRSATMWSLAYQFLQHYHSVPCSSKDGLIDEKGLWTYIMRLLELAKEHNYIQGAESMIGRILGNFPENDTYPSDLLCQLVEKINSDIVDSEIICAIYNKRSFSLRAYNSGGEIERQHVRSLKKYKERAQLKSRRMTKILDVSIRNYEQKATREDFNSKISALKY